jgi:hypothetical protein
MHFESGLHLPTWIGVRHFPVPQNQYKPQPINGGLIVELLENYWQAGVRERAAEEMVKIPPVVDRVLIIAYRKKKKESQRRFWSRFGVTQSRGSRFESGAEIPAPVSILLGLYFTKTISDSDLGRAERVMGSPEFAALLNPAQSAPVVSQ